jgi:hypothetical protein
LSVPLETPENLQGDFFGMACDWYYPNVGIAQWICSGGRLVAKSFPFVSSFNPLPLVWTSLTPLPAARSVHSMNIIGDIMFIFGGSITGSLPNSILLIRNMLTDGYISDPTPSNNRPAARSYHSTVTIPGQGFFLYGGVASDGYHTVGVSIQILLFIDSPDVNLQCSGHMVFQCH